MEEILHKVVDHPAQIHRCLASGHVLFHPTSALMLHGFPGINLVFREDARTVTVE